MGHRACLLLASRQSPRGVGPPLGISRVAKDVDVVRLLRSRRAAAPAHELVEEGVHVQDAPGPLRGPIVRFAEVARELVEPTQCIETTRELCFYSYTVFDYERYTRHANPYARLYVRLTILP